MKIINIIFLSLIISGCSSFGKRGTNPDIQFFQGKASDDCEFLGYIDSEASEKNEEDSFDECKEELYQQAYKYRANALKIVTVNRVLSKINISAEAYRCSSLIKLKVSEETKLDFSF